MITPSYLSENSKIAIVAPARKVTCDEISYAIEYIKNQGYIPVYDERLFLSHNQFAGTDDERAAVLQYYLDSDDIDAILCARGGYGTIRIIDKLNFDKFIKLPKWVIGYSDVTVLHAKLQSIGVASIHATMPINFKSNTQKSLDSLFDVLKGKDVKYDIQDTHNDKEMTVEAEIVGGNISVLYSLLGSDIFPNTDGKLLFLEDVDEYLYHIDRMMTALKRAGKLDNIVGLIVGGLTKIHDNTIPFGLTVEDIILEKIADMNIPVYFNFPAGHIENNQAIVLGEKIRLSCL